MDADMPLIFKLAPTVQMTSVQPRFAASLGAAPR